MSIFGTLIRTVVNVATLPLAVAADVVTLGGQINNPGGQSYTGKTLDKIKDEAESK